MTCQKCKGAGWYVREVGFRDKSGNKDWNYEKRPCTQCHGKGYLTPAEVGQESM